MVEHHPSSAKERSGLSQFGRKVLRGIFIGFSLHAGEASDWKTFCGRGCWEAGQEGRVINPRSEIRCKKKEVLIPKTCDKFIFPVADDSCSLRRTNQSSGWEEFFFWKSSQFGISPHETRSTTMFFEADGRVSTNKRMMQKAETNYGASSGKNISCHHAQPRANFMCQTTCLSNYHSSKKMLSDGHVQVWMCSWKVVWSRLGTGRVVDRLNQVYNMERKVCKRLHVGLRATHKSAQQLEADSVCVEVWSGISKKISTERETVLDCWKSRCSTMLEHWETFITSIQRTWSSRTPWKWAKVVPLESVLQRMSRSPTQRGEVAFWAPTRGNTMCMQRSNHESVSKCGCKRLKKKKTTWRSHCWEGVQFGEVLQSCRQVHFHTPSNDNSDCESRTRQRAGEAREVSGMTRSTEQERSKNEDEQFTSYVDGLMSPQELGYWAMRVVLQDSVVEGYSDWYKVHGAGLVSVTKQRSQKFWMLSWDYLDAEGHTSDVVYTLTHKSKWRTRQSCWNFRNRNVPILDFVVTSHVRKTWQIIEEPVFLLEYGFSIEGLQLEETARKNFSQRKGEWYHQPGMLVRASPASFFVIRERRRHQNDWGRSALWNSCGKYWWKNLIWSVLRRFLIR